MGNPRLLRPFVFLLIFVGIPFIRTSAQTADSVTQNKDIEPTVHALCSKRIALLGESPIHGFGETLEFKTELVRQLVQGCHYNALFIESGIYDYINIEKRLKSGQDVTDAMISSAIGGLWANKEVQALVPFLTEKVKAGSLTLGGMDDQIGRGSYASREMSSDLVQPLQDGERSRCLAILQKHLLWQYTATDPYGPSDKAKIVGCLNEVEARLAQPDENQKPWTVEDKAMVDSLKRNLARNFTEDDFTKKDQEVRWVNDRDKSMYVNFQWLLTQLPKNSKVIVWAATVHVAKNLNNVDGFEGRVPLGSYIKRDFKNRAFSLGFSAYSGDYQFTHSPIRQLSTAPSSSLEGRVFAHSNSNTVFLSQRQLQKYGLVAARPLGTSFKTVHWDQVVDGLVVFRKEHAPAWLSH